jgi:prepilin-type N-terminal cleavage/methylation domain-containing protein
MRPLTAAGATRRRTLFRAFTLIELMVVVGIMGILMTMSVPLVYKVTRREPLNKAVRSVVESCSHARARAILKGRMTELVFFPQERRFEVVHGAPHRRPSQEEGADPEPPRPAPEGLSGHFPESIAIEMLDVNLIEYKDKEMARVRFYPNGTCDEFTLILRSDKGEWIKIWLEITTALAEVGPVDR